MFINAVLSDWVHPPLFFFLMRALDAIIGLNDATGRIVAIVFGSLSIPTIYWLGQRLFSKNVGTVAAIMLALSPIHVWHSDYGRHYSLFVLLVMLSLLTFVELWRNPKSNRWSILFILTNALLVYTHYFGWLLVLVETVTFALFRIISIRRWLILHATLGLAYVPWMIAVISFVSTDSTGDALIPQVAWLNPPRLITPIMTLIEFHGPIPVPRAGLVSLIMLTGLATLALKRVFDKSSGWPSIILLILSVCIPFVLVFALSWLVQPLWLPRVMMVSLPAYYLLIAVGSLHLSEHRIGLVAPLIPIAWFIVASYFHFDRPHRHPFKLITEYLEKNARAGDLIIAQNYYVANSVYFYYKGDGTIYQIGDSHISILPDARTLANVQALAEISEQVTRVMVVTYLHQNSDIQDHLPEELKIRSEQKFQGKGEDWLKSRTTITVTVYER
jgi:uncharacterized membrane protein